MGFRAERVEWSTSKEHWPRSHLLTDFRVMTAVLSYCGFLAPISSTTILSAVPEVAADFHTSGTIIAVSNALYLIFMGLSPLFWGPVGQIYGRRWPCLVSLLLFFAFSLGTALSPNLASFFIFRVLTAFQGTSLLIIGASCIGDIFKPVARATALGWFLSGTLVGPAFGPFAGGCIITYRTWRDIFWLQTALAGAGVVLVFFFLKETIHYKKSTELKGLTPKAYAKQYWEWSNPWRVVRLFRYPNLIIVSVASSSLVFNMYSALTPIRYILNPRFHLTTPMQSGFIYLAPGAGYLLGTTMGGRWADRTVRRWIAKRGHRVPEDRLHSALPFMGGVIPAAMLVYGWCVQTESGGIAVPVVALFVQGVAQLFCFPCLNVYCLDVMQGRSSEVVAGNYAVRYFFGAIGTAAVLPAIQKIGPGGFSTISAGFLFAATGLVYLTARFGKGWREKIDSDRAVREAGETAQVAAS
ncbi:MFS general substrate transporter [Microthyrium microscopicum]|uniref:MFS general substrate transporter n=1 Tax=Microthyrium microscopicum TaxID=703497 RepID=A0A6A6UK91_9PEZI|nr:MFS general substrate transporter [Microthyrium microscopicum]